MPLFNAILFNQALFGGDGGAGAGCPVLQVGNGILYPALRKAGITIGTGRTPSPAQFQDAIDELNRLISSLNCDRLAIWALDTLEIPITESKPAYTIGCDPAGIIEVDLHTDRRPHVISGAVLISQNARYPVLAATPEIWAMRDTETLNTNLPDMLYYDRGWPIGQILFYGQPQAGMMLQLWAWHLIPRAQSLDDALAVPMGYDDALVLNLACRLAPHFQRQIDADVRQQARESLMRVMSINAPQPIAPLGLGCECGDWDVYSGGHR